LKRLLSLILVIFAGISGCSKDPIHTRDSQEPAGSTGTWETPATPEAVVTNLMYAYIEKNIQNYQLCLAEKFFYSAFEDSIEAEAQGNGYLYHDWNKEVEVSVTENIFSAFSASGYYLDLLMSSSSDYPDSIGDTLAVIYRDYTIRIVTADSLIPDTSRVEGLAAFHLSQSLFSWWSIYLWEEGPSAQGGYDWGDFKAEYRSR
jgi:hypothetical protein